MINEWNDNIEWIKDGEPVTASVTNRPPKQIWQNLQVAWSILQNHVFNYNNPHKITAEQLGIDLSGATSLQDYIALIVKDIAGSFVADGFDVSIYKIDEVNSEVILKITPGRAYLAGRPINKKEPFFATVSLKRYSAKVTSEPKIFTKTGSKIFRLNEGPLGNTTQVLADIVATETITRGAVPGGIDYLSNTPVLQILSVTQGTTTYIEGQDFQLNGNGIDWSLSGNEPALGSTYTVQYIYRGALTKDVHYKDGSNLVSGTYYYAVVAVNSAGEEGKIDPTKVKQLDIVRSGKYVYLKWEPITEAAYYKIYASSDGTNFYLAGTTTFTEFTDYGLWDTTKTPIGTSTTLAVNITQIEDRYSNAIVLINDPGIQDNSRILIDYIWYMPSYALVVVTKDGTDVVYGPPSKDPVVPKVPNGTLGIAKVYVPGLDPSKLLLSDIKVTAPKVDVLQGALKRIENLEYTVLRRDFELLLQNKDTAPKKGIFADNFLDPRYIDMNHPLYSAEYTGVTIEPKRSNLSIHYPTISSTNGVKNVGSNNYMLNYTEILEIDQPLATRTVDIISASFNTKKVPTLIVYGLDVEDSSLSGVLYQGKKFKAVVTGFAPSTTVTVTVGGVQVGTINTDAEGNGEGIFTIPNNLLNTSVYNRLLQAVGGALRTTVQNIFEILRSAERSLWPTIVKRTTNRRWIENGIWLITQTTRVTTTRLGLDEGEPLQVDLSSLVLIDVRAEDQTGNLAIQNVLLTENPISVPISIPRLVLREETRVTTRSWRWRRWRRRNWIDPIAESFKLNQPGTITAIAVRFASAPSDLNQELIFRLGILKDGFPSEEVLDEIRIPASEILNAINNNNGWYKIKLTSPIYVDDETYLYFSLASNSPGFKVYCARMGDGNLDYNPYLLGTFFYSGDGKTWTAVQEQDVTFKVYTAKFQNASVDDSFRGNYILAGEIDFGEITGLTASVLVLDATVREPESTSVFFYYSTDSGNTWKPITEKMDTLIGSLTNKVRLKAVLVSMSDRISPILSTDDLSVITFTYAQNSTYVSTMIEMFQNSENIELYIYASIPSGQSITVYISPDDGKTWLPATLKQSTPWDLNRGIYEYIYTVTIDTANYPDSKYRIRVDLSSDGITPLYIDQIGMVLK